MYFKFRPMVQELSFNDFLFFLALVAILFTVWNDLSNLVQGIMENMRVNFNLGKVVQEMLFGF